MKLEADYKGDDDLIPQFMLSYLFYFLKASDPKSKYRVKREGQNFILYKSSNKSPDKYVVAMGYNAQDKHFISDMTSSPLVLRTQFFNLLKPIVIEKYDTEMQSALIESWRLLRFAPPALSEKIDPDYLILQIATPSFFNLLSPHKLLGIILRICVAKIEALGF